ncbi:hypothetical protein PHYPSEUDO_001858 [Phytophthora pseudosyringae]|uniref:M96 mating-specific protein family n=1 Tax=Phytophthora pseudosyringae TaxID=221518 RepID=A0A8T1V202_9STRA|nr:hypothetical protein PHYPSEUDO_001858 [Phytophthora pseudosyringae]
MRKLIEARRGSKTTPRTDLVLSKAFWRRVATQQCDQRLRVEAERVNSQGAFIESMGVALPKFSSTLVRITSSDDNGNGDRIDDLKRLRLKSSVSTLYTTYLQEVANCYTRIDCAFQDAGMESLPIGVVDASYRYKTNGDVEYFQHRNRLLQPFDEKCRVMWELATLPHRQNDRQVYQDVFDPENTVGVQFRLQTTLPSSSAVSIVKHVVARRFVERHRVVIVWKIF